MTTERLKELVSIITGYEITRIEKINENLFKVLVKGSVYPHHRFGISNQVPITLGVLLEEGWE